jgi:hypothetical protein
MRIKNLVISLIFLTSTALVSSGCGGTESAGDVVSPTDTTVIPDSTDDTVQSDTSQPDTTDSDTTQADTTPPDPWTSVEISAEVEGSVEALVSDPTVYVAALNGDRVLYETELGVSEISKVDGTPVDYGLDAGSLNGVVHQEDVLLVSTELGLFVEDEGLLVPSPLGEFFEETQFMAVQAGGEADDPLIWIVADDTLHLWQGDMLYPVDLGLSDLPTVASHLSYGATVDGAPALWMAGGSNVYAVTTEGDDVYLWHVRDDLTAADMAVDADDTLWVVADGDLHVRSPDGTWEWLRLPEPVVSVAGNVSSGGVWLTTATQLIRTQDGEFYTVTGVLPDTLLAADGATRSLVAGANGVHRVLMGEPPPPPKVTWKNDIEPIHMSRCATCHGPLEYFTKEELWYDSADKWEANIDLILAAVSPGCQVCMPLAGEKLTPEQIGLIETWKDGGFLEE